MDNTIILRFADHGEGGLSHGFREKAYTAYEEMIHVPLIVHNRRLYPEPLETMAFYDHRDLLPTILDLAGVRDAEFLRHRQEHRSGHAEIRQSRSQDHTLFSFDDVFFVPPTAPNSHIRAMREGDWTYAAYFSLRWRRRQTRGIPLRGGCSPMAKRCPAYGHELHVQRNPWSDRSSLLHGAPTEE